MTSLFPIGAASGPDQSETVRLEAVTDDVPTLLGAGLLAYVAETLLHEAVGHGGVCLASGFRFTLLAPLWMRCSVTTPALTAAGPAANILAAIGLFVMLRLAPPARPLARLLLWLGFTFNALVACGYLGVGAATGFGDWPTLFAWVSPSIGWRLPAALISVAGYVFCLRIAAFLFRRLAGSGQAALRRFWRWSLVPAAGAAIVAVLAEIFGGRAQPLPLLLASGCTLLVGFSLTSMTDAVGVARHEGPDALPIARSWWLIVAAMAVAAGFILAIGPGLDLTRLS